MIKHGNSPGNKVGLMFFALLLLVQLSHASEKDSLIVRNPFSRYLSALEDDYYCDACGCSASGGSMGFSSILNSNFIGIRYFSQRYNTTDGLYSNSPWYTENFNTVQVWARIPIVNNFQLSVVLPYHYNSRETDAGNESISGLGDLTVLAMYRLYQTHTDSTYLVHTWQVGLGVKAPLGKYNTDNNGSVNPSFQLGTGSWDYLLATEYVVKRKRLGLNLAFNYVFKTENRKWYRFGNQANYSGTFFWLYEKNDYSFAPQLGVAGEVYGSNYHYGIKVKDTSGDVYFGRLGFEVGKNKWSFGANAMLPVNQNLTGGNVEAKRRWSLNVNYSL